MDDMKSLLKSLGIVIQNDFVFVVSIDIEKLNWIQATSIVD